MSKYELIIDSANIGSVTGIHEIECHIQETRDDGTTVKGSPEVYGIEAVALGLKHGGDPVKWREWVAVEMKDKYIRRTGAHSEILRWKGQRFEVK